MLGQYEVAEPVTLTFRPPYPEVGPIYTASNVQGSLDYAGFDYLACAFDTIGFTQSSAIIRFLPQFYRASPSSLPLKSLLKSGLRRWEVSVTKNGEAESSQVIAITIDNSGLILELGSPIDALTYPSHPFWEIV